MEISSIRWRSFLLGVFFIIACHTMEAITTRDVFARHQNEYFIETGSYLGDGIQMALDAGFQKVYSIELSPYYYQLCRSRFAENSNVVIVFGDSTTELPKLLQYVDAPATFWLDGHYSWGNTARGETNTPLMCELESIGQHPIKTHTILIDDIRQCGTIEFDFIELDDIIKKILEINPDYKIIFENGYVPNDVLVAEIQ